MVRNGDLEEVREALDEAREALGYCAAIGGGGSPTLALRVVRALEATAAAVGLCDDLAAGRVVEG